MATYKKLYYVSNNFIRNPFFVKLICLYVFICIQHEAKYNIATVPGPCQIPLAVIVLYMIVK